MMATVHFTCITPFLSQNGSAHDDCCASFLDSVSWKKSIIRLFTETLQTDKFSTLKIKFSTFQKFDFSEKVELLKTLLTEYSGIFRALYASPCLITFLTCRKIEEAWPYACDEYTYRKRI